MDQIKDSDGTFVSCYSIVFIPNSPVKKDKGTKITVKVVNIITERSRS